MLDLVELCERLSYVAWERRSENCIGHGTFGSVYVGQREVTTTNNSQWDEGPVAVKVPSTPLQSQREIQRFMNEVVIMSEVDHPAVLPLFAWGYVDGDYLVVTEKLVTNLEAALQDERRGKSSPNWNATSKSIIALGTAAGLAYLHKKRVIHRHVKPSNVLLDNSCRPRIGDFALATVVASEQQMRMTTGIGSPLYMAPELHSEAEHPAYGPGVDVFAWAMIFYELITGVRPFSDREGGDSGLNVAKWVTDGQRPTMPDDIPPQQREILENCWRQKQDERWTFDDVLPRSDALMLDGCDQDEFAQYKTLVCTGLVSGGE
jgi:serine/threonine protein kinase